MRELYRLQDTTLYTVYYKKSNTFRSHDVTNEHIRAFFFCYREAEDFLTLFR
jgi:hypothetical protein